MEIKRVALIGAGAIGAYFIRGLSDKPGENLMISADGERAERLRKNGLDINDRHYTLNVKASEEIGPVDLILVSVKYNALPGVLKDIQNMTGENTVVMSLMNGVDSEEIIGTAIDPRHILYSYMMVASARVGGSVHFPPDDRQGVHFGERGSSEKTGRMLAVEELFRGTTVAYHMSEDILAEMWHKYAINVSENLPQAIVQVGAGAFRDSEHLSYISRRIWDEVAAVAEAECGVQLGPKGDTISRLKDSTRSSTCQDIMAGRHTEADMFGGVLLKKAAQHQIPVPFTDFAYHAVKVLEEKNDHKFDYE